MEIELSLEEKNILIIIATVLLVLGLPLGSLVLLGRSVSPVSPDGIPRLLTWQDWRLLQAEKDYQAELNILRADADELIDLLNQRPDPVSAQMLADRILRDTRNGSPALAAARDALAQAAFDVRDWAIGRLDRDAAMISLQNVLGLLQ